MFRYIIFSHFYTKLYTDGEICVYYTHYNILLYIFYCTPNYNVKTDVR